MDVIIANTSTSHTQENFSYYFNFISSMSLDYAHNISMTVVKGRLSEYESQKLRGKKCNKSREEVERVVTYRLSLSTQWNGCHRTLIQISF